MAYQNQSTIGSLRSEQIAKTTWHRTARFDCSVDRNYRWCQFHPRNECPVAIHFRGNS